MSKVRLIFRASGTNLSSWLESVKSFSAVGVAISFTGGVDRVSASSGLNDRSASSLLFLSASLSILMGFDTATENSGVPEAVDLLKEWISTCSPREFLITMAEDGFFGIKGCAFACRRDFDVVIGDKGKLDIVGTVLCASVAALWIGGSVGETGCVSGLSCDSEIIGLHLKMVAGDSRAGLVDTREPPTLD
jgi:hypothetical protein